MPGPLGEASTPRVRPRKARRLRKREYGRTLDRQREYEEKQRSTKRALKKLATHLRSVQGDNPLLDVDAERASKAAEKSQELSAKSEALKSYSRSKDAPSTREVLEIASLGVPGLGVVGAGAKGARLASAAAKAIRASEKAAPKAARAAKGAENIRKAKSKAVFRGGKAKRIEDVKVRPRSKARRTASKAAKTRTGRAVGKGAKTAGRVATFPVRRPKTTLAGGPIAAQVPAAAFSGDPAELKKGLEGTGTLAAALSKIGESAASVTPGKIPSNLAKDALNLPAVALPSVYLTGAAGFEAAKGDTSRAKEMLREYEKAGLLPALVRGDLKGAGEAFENHPLYTGLEASGAASVVGRAAGAAARAGTRGRVGGTARPDMKIQGYENLRETGRRYSPDLIRQGVQRGGEAMKRRRGRDPFIASERKAKRMIDERADRFAYEREVVRRMNRDTVVQAVEKHRPGGRGRAAARKMATLTDNPTAGVVSLAVQRFIRKPETFGDDLRTYREQLIQAQKSGELTRSERKANQELVKRVDRAIEAGDPETAFEAAQGFIQHHADSVDELISRGLLDVAQAKKAAAIPFAKTFMGAGFGRPRKRDGEEGSDQRQLLDRDGDPLPLHKVEAEMLRQGVEPPGFVTHRPGSRGGGSFYRSFFPERQRMPNQKRTGEAASRGTFDASYDALVEQAARTRSIADGAIGFDEFVKRFGKEPPRGVKNFNDAWRVLRDPEDFGVNLPDGVEFVPFRTQPFAALKRETQAALEHQGRLDPEQERLLEQLPSRALVEAQRDGPGPVVLMPRTLIKRMEAHHAQLLEGEKAVGAVTSTVKGVWLPTSPGWIYGNAFDMNMRSMMSGGGPFDYFLGRKAAKTLPEGARASIITGAQAASYKRVQVRRDAQQFSGMLGGVARSLHTLSRKPGPRQLVDAYRKYRDAVFYFNTRFIEKQPQYAILGKEVRREVQAKTGQWHHALMVGDDALADIALGLRNTDKQIAYAKSLETVFGNWGKNSPGARRFLTNLAPFWMWARAASRFVALTMPARHPIKSALIAAAAEMTEEERSKLGLDKFLAERLPGFLQGGLPVFGSVAPIAKWSSFGFFADYPGNLADMVFPQGGDAIRAMTGYDWKGDQLVDAEGRPVPETERVKAALLTQLEAFIPFLTVGRQIAEDGPNRAFNPLRTYDKETLDFLRSLSESQQITIPASGGGGGEVDSYKVFGGGESEGPDSYKVFGGG